MSIQLSDLSFHFPNQHPLFYHLTFSVEDREKVSIVGNNGAGKSTLLRLMAGHLQATAGSVRASSVPYYIPQHSGSLNISLAQALRVDAKLAALEAITQGSVEQSDYDILADDWDIEARCASALAYWQLDLPDLNSSIDLLSGGEKTKVFLAGLSIHAPGIILLDEPSNHLDERSREMLYRFVRQATSTLVVVSHDITLLDLLETTCELSEKGIRPYGGNYSFYKQQKEIETGALADSIHEQEKALRLARKQAQEIRERQERRASQGEKAREKKGGPRILINALGNKAENTAAKLKGKHTDIVRETSGKLADLKEQKEKLRELKIDFDNTNLHAGKLLIEAQSINIAYSGNKLWENPLDFKLYSNDRIRITGDNGSGKTSLLRVLCGMQDPSEGFVRRADFSWIYLDQNYTEVDRDCRVEELAEAYNFRKLPEHEIKIRLNRFLFPVDSWDKSCRSLSGGEKMRLFLCCLMIRNQTPDLIVLDEPTNNLDMASLQILTQTIRNYRGSLLVISHDRYFIEEIGVGGSLNTKTRRHEE